MCVRLRAILFLAVIAFCISMGCIDRFYEKPVTPTIPPTLTPVPTLEGTVSTIPPDEMALQLTDLPSDYFIKDRSATSYEEQPTLNRDLGWRQGYTSEFYRMNIDTADLTVITQTIGVYPLENMNTVFSVEKDDLLPPVNGIKRYEIPFPAIGTKSLAVRETDPDDVVTYTIIFISKNVAEKITMTGTTTDYEALKNIVKIAEARIR